MAQKEIGLNVKSSSPLPFHLCHKEEGTGGSHRDSFTEKATLKKKKKKPLKPNHNHPHTNLALWSPNSSNTLGLHPLFPRLSPKTERAEECLFAQKGSWRTAFSNVVLAGRWAKQTAPMSRLVLSNSLINWPQIDGIPCHRVTKIYLLPI